MKKSIITLLILTIVLVSSSCRDTYDDYPQERGATIGFTSLPLEEVPLPPGGELNFPVPFFVTTISSSDRTFEVAVVPEETTLSQDNYSFETTVTVPANERSGSFMFTATNNSISSDEFQTVMVGFVGVDGVTSGRKWFASLISTD